MTAAERAEQLIGDILSSLGHVDLTYIVADLCTLAGWDTQLGIGDPETVGDVVAMQSFPHPHTVSIVCQTDNRLTQEDLAEMRQAVGRDSLLAVVASNQPTDDSIEYARTEGILLFSPYDLTHELVTESGIELIQDYLTHDSDLSTEFANELEELATLQLEFEASDAEPEIGHADLPQADTRPLVETADTRVGVYGVEYLMADGETDVVLLALRIEHATDTQFAPDEFTLTTDEDGDFTGAAVDSTTDVGQLVEKLSDILESEWAVSTSHLPAGKVAKGLVLFEVGGDVELASLSYRDVTVALSPPAPGKTYQGLPSEVCDPIETLLGGDFRSGPAPADTIWALSDSALHPLSGTKPTQPATSESATESVEATDEKADPAEVVDSEPSASMNTDLLDEIEDAVQPVLAADRKPDVSLVGQGTAFSETVSAPGGVTFFEMTFSDNARYKVTAVGDTAEDSVVKVASDETPISHRVIDELDEGSYILNVEADDGAHWELDVYFSAPDAIDLPYSTSGRGHDVIGPIPHSGFIKVAATNYHTGTLRIKQPRETGKSYLNSPSLSVGASDDSSGVTNEQVISTIDGHKTYPWLEIRSDGEWEVTVTPHE